MARLPNTPRQRKQQQREQNTVVLKQFPLDHRQVHSMILYFYKYNSRQKTPIPDLSKSILLPIPDNLLQTSNLRVSSTELGLAGAAVTEAINAGKDVMSLEGILNTLSSSSSGDVQAAGDLLVRAALKAAVSYASPGIQRGTETATGRIMNPFQAIAFDGVDLRTHSFTWTMSPRSQAESDELHEIIRHINRSIHPKYGNADSGSTYYNTVDGGVDAVGDEVGGQPTAESAISRLGSKIFLEYPDLVIPVVYGSRSVVFKPCMVSQFQVDYAGSGEPSFYAGGDPSVIKMTMTMTESKIWTRDDF